MSKNVIGISALFHDSACCLLKDGELVAAAEEERFSRIKHDPSMPKNAFRYCLKEGNLSIDEIDCIAFYENPTKKLSRQLWMAFTDPRLRTWDENFKLSETSRPERMIRKVLGYDGEIKFFDHHQSHAASAFFYSGFQDAAILTVDGVGEWATTSYGFASDSEIKILEEVEFPHSLGLLYSTVTSYLGFEVNDAEYKVMGLAPYGQAKYLSQMQQLISSGPKGQYQLEMKYFDFLRRDRMFSDEFIALFGHPPRVPESDLKQFHHDVARSIQNLLEEILLQKCEYLRSIADSDNLCMAGGVALNCVANGKIARSSSFKRLFIQPAASDAGGALGAAALAHRELEKVHAKPVRMQHTYWGVSYTNSDVQNFLELATIPFEDFRGKNRELIDETARRLSSGQVAGWFQGRMELGPRSLGARSILGDPRGPEMRDRINALVKMRESFRPFAPAVLLEQSKLHFDLDHESPFMLETCNVISNLDLPAVTHVDGSARVQTVSPESHPRFHDLLTAFERLTGCPILLNTSFNLRGEPIVCSPSDAISTFLRSNIDFLVIEDFLIDRNALDKSWILEARERLSLLNKARAPRDGSVSHNIYTFF